AFASVIAAVLLTARRHGPGEPSDADVAQALRQARGDSAAPALAPRDVTARPAAPPARTAPSAPAAPAARANAADNAAEKSRFVHFVKGFDVSDLSPERRELFLRFANAERCTCGCGYTLAGCRAYDPTCPISEPRVQKLLDSVRAGLYTTPPDTRRRPAPGG
ncbi:MAG TPA: hypothetical protein VI792_03005, partial [Candidatus Eisenbacteria bacterium]